MLQRDYPLNEKNLDWWVNEKESPYTEVKRFDWYRGYQVGGRSLTVGPPELSPRATSTSRPTRKEGIAIDWPIRYADIAPWYDHVERHAGIAGSLEGLPQLPDGQFQPAMPLNCGEELDRRPRREALRRQAPHHPGPRREPDAAAAGPRAVPVPQRVLARLPVRRVLQHAVVDAAGGDGDGAAHAQAVRDRHRGALRRGPQARDRRARDRRASPSRRRNTRRRSSSSARRRSTRRGC